MEEPEYYQFQINTAKVAELWRRGSVIASWLLDLTAAALQANPTLEGLAGRVSDSGEGRWTVKAAVDIGVPAPVLAASLFERFASRDEDHFANQVLSAMRQQLAATKSCRRAASSRPAARRLTRSRPPRKLSSCDRNQRARQLAASVDLTCEQLLRKRPC